MHKNACLLLLASVAACGDDGRPDTGQTGTTPPATASATATTTTDLPTSANDATSAQTSDPTPTTTTDIKLDLGAQGTTDPTDTTTGPPVDACKVQDDMNAIGECNKKAPPDSFEPEIQWAWTGPDGDILSVVTPLVANLTDDNGDGEIDLCDIPDIVVVASPDIGADGHIYVLDGATGTLHFKISTPVSSLITPALGDIDGDGLVEIVTSDISGLLAFGHDGALKWQSASPWLSAFLGAVALADVDADGDVEILAGDSLYDHNGVQLWIAPGGAPSFPSTTAADLDGDGDLEIVLGHTAVHHDGSIYYTADILPGFPQVADLDGDPEPEILVTNNGGLTLLEHDGTIKYEDLRPTGDPGDELVWLRPATVQDFDGDGVAEFAVSSGNNYTTYRGDATILWQTPVSDLTGVAAGTAFDFLGDGVAEAMYADEHTMFVFGPGGAPLLQIPRTSVTGTEYPIVADVDNDGSAEIVVVSNEYLEEPPAPTVQVIRDKQDRWIQARRIWNQHTYHVTNVREDGTIPQHEPPSWQRLNTFRTNAQIENGGLCEPPIPG